MTVGTAFSLAILLPAVLILWFGALYIVAIAASEIIHIIRRFL